MTTRFSIQVPHRMGPEQACGRLRTLATGAKREYCDRIEIHEERWFTRGCIFSLTINFHGERRVWGVLRVDPSHVHLEGHGEFPAFVRPRVERVLEREASRLLGRVKQKR